MGTLLRGKRTLWFVAAALACVLIVAGLYVARNMARAAEACAPNQANADAAPKTAGTGPVEAHILGDSYTSGFALDSPSDGFAYKLAELEGWSATVDGFPGSGFATGSACGDQEYTKRAAEVPANAALVLIEGGLNDVAEGTADQVADAAAETVRTVKDKAPAARVVVLGPTLVPYFPEADTRAVDAVLSMASTVEGFDYISALEFEADTVDQVHLTPENHTKFAQWVSGRLH